jgi:hypothetical protein
MSVLFSDFGYRAKCLDFRRRKAYNSNRDRKRNAFFLWLISFTLTLPETAVAQSSDELLLNWAWEGFCVQFYSICMFISKLPLSVTWMNMQPYWVLHIDEYRTQQSVILSCYYKSVNIITKLGMDDWGSFPGRGGKWFFIITTASRQALRPTHLREALFPRKKWPGHEADHSPQSSAEVKNCGAVPPIPHTSSWLKQGIRGNDVVFS